MRTLASVCVSAILLSACSGAKAVQLHPPATVPAGLVSGYGVDKDWQVAYQKALVDLIVRASDHPSEEAFRRLASKFLKPSFMDSGVKSGVTWILLGSTRDELEHGWDSFAEWRTSQVEEALHLYESAQGVDRIPALRAADAMMEEAGVQDVQLHASADAEKQFRVLLDSGQLRAAEHSLDGMDPVLAEACRVEVIGRRKEALAEMLAGDDHFRREEYDAAIDRYHEASRLDRDNPQLPDKIAMAQEQHRNSRIGKVRMTASAINWGARIVSGLISEKRDEDRRKQEEAEREARREERRRPRTRQDSPPPAAPAATPAVEPVPEKKDGPDSEVIKEETPREKLERLKKKDPPPGI